MRKFSFIFILSVSFTFLAYADKIEDIKKSVDESNFCTVVEDCVIIGAQCPIGCNIAVNKSKEKEIRGLLQGIENPCMYKCWHSKNLDCIKNKCEVVR